jgi:hypothetical protein
VLLRGTGVNPEKRPRAPRALVAALAIACATVGLATLAGATAASSESGSAPPELFVTGSLADSDYQALSGASATASILAVGGAEKPSRIASIEVEVDGKRAAVDRVRCHGKCPRSEAFQFRYRAKRFGPGAHEVVITATNANGTKLRRTITIDKKVGGKKSGVPRPVPAFYMTGLTNKDLKRQATSAAAQVARKQDSGHTLLALDFGAARLKHGTFGTSLSHGTFFSNKQITAALQAAARSYHDNYRRGAVTIVYANSNGHIGENKSGYTQFHAGIARKAGKAQGRMIADLKLYPHESAAVGGDIEPGYDDQPNLSVAMVEGALAGDNNMPYYDFGTAPCQGKKCVNGWLVKHICEVTAGGRRSVLPEIYNVSPNDPTAVWKRVQKTCGIKSFGGVSANVLGNLSPRQSWLRLKRRTNVKIGDALVVWPK